MTAKTRKGLTPKQEQAQMIRTIGQRMKEARQLSGFSQLKAAELLGYRNSSKLSKVEQATDTNSIPLWLIQRAALVYEVSVDWLFGLSDDWEISNRMLTERNTDHWLFNHWEKQRLADIQALKYLHDKIDAISTSVKDSVTAVLEVSDSLDSVRNLNKEFDNEIRGGSRLVNAVEKARDISNIAEAKLKRFFNECKVLRIEDNAQPDLFNNPN